MIRLERATGPVSLHVAPHGIERLREEGCLEVRFPKRSGAFEAVFATLLHAAPDAEGCLDALREALPAQAAGATSPVPGLVLARVLAADGATLRRHVLRALDILRDGRHPPRVWQC